MGAVQTGPFRRIGPKQGTCGTRIAVSLEALRSGVPGVRGAISWKSTDDGHTFQWVASPFGVTNSTTGLAGEDSDIAAASRPNAHGFYNVYAAEPLTITR